MPLICMWNMLLGKDIIFHIRLQHTSRLDYDFLAREYSIQGRYTFHIGDIPYQVLRVSTIGCCLDTRQVINANTYLTLSTLGTLK